MKTIKLLCSIILWSLCLIITGQNMTMNPENSYLNWTGKAAFNAYSLTGSLKVKKGRITIQDNQITALDVRIDMTSLDHDNADLKAHLRSADFFEVNTYTEAQFRLNQPAIITDGKARITGLMTIKNQTQEESFEIRIDKNSSELSFDICLDRTAYGVTFNSPSFFKRMKDNAIADDFKLKALIYLEP